jgi:hypothetical protein
MSDFSRCENLGFFCGASVDGKRAAMRDATPESRGFGRARHVWCVGERTCMTGRSITLFIPFIPLTVCSVISSDLTVTHTH